MNKIESYNEVANDILATIDINCLKVMKILNKGTDDNGLHQRALESLLAIRDESIRSMSDLNFGIKSDGTYGKIED